MSSFRKLLEVSPLPDGRSWVLLRGFTYDVGALGSGVHITVPKGFQTDFASVPRIAWMFINKQGYHTNASVLHDFLYWEQKLPRRIADALFLEAMEAGGTLWTVRKTMFLAVRVFGFIAWYGNQKDRERGHNRVLAVLPRANEPVPRRGIDRWIHDWFSTKPAPLEPPPAPKPAAAPPDILSGFTDKTISTPKEGGA